MGRYRLLMDILSNTVAFILVFNFFVLVYTMLNDVVPWPYLLLAIPFFFLFFLRRKIKKMMYFLIFHVVLLAAPLLALDDIRIFMPILGFAIVSVVYSLNTKGKGEWSMPGVTAAWVVGILAGLSLLFNAYVPHLAGIGALLNISSLVALAAIVLYVHLDNLRFSLATLKGLKSKSVQVTSTSKFLITVFLIMIVLFGALSILFPSQSAVLMIAQLVGQILLLPIRLMVLLAGLFFGETEGEGAGGIPPILMMDGEMEEQPPLDDPAFAILSTIMGAIAMIIIIIVAVAILGVLFRGLYRAFNKKNNDSGKQSLMPDDIKSKLKFVFGAMRELLPRFRISVKHPVRRAYIKKVNSHIKQGFRALPHYTPEVIADKIRPTEDIDELTQKYEEARYGRG